MTDPHVPPGFPEEVDRTTVFVRRAVDGDGAGVEWVIDHFTPLLLVAAERRLGPHLRRFYDPEDVVNELWVATMPRLGDLVEREGRLTPVLLRFLSTALVSRINNLARTFARHRPSADAAQAGGDEPPSPFTGVVTRASRGDTALHVRQLLAALPETDREILILRGIEQNSNQEVARRLGIDPNAAAVRYHRALERVRSRLTGTPFDEI